MLLGFDVWDSVNGYKVPKYLPTYLIERKADEYNAKFVNKIPCGLLKPNSLRS